MKRTSSSNHCQALLFKYKKFKARLDKAIRNGSFARYTYRKRQMLIRRLERLGRQLAGFNNAWRVGMAAAATTVVLATAPTESAAQTFIQKAGTEFQVNDYTTLAQRDAAIAVDADGDFVIVWSGGNDQDGSGYGIFAQQYNSNGVPSILGEFQVNEYTTGTQSSPSVAMDADGDFVVSWASYGQDGSKHGIYAKRYNANGTISLSDFPVNTITTNSQNSPSVAMDAAGNFTIVWDGVAASYTDVYARRYDANGIAETAEEFLVNTYTTSSQISPSIAMDADGDFVVVWTSFGQDDDSAPLFGGIYAQRYNASGVPDPQGEFPINTHTTGKQSGPSVAMDDAGDFVVTWLSEDLDGFDFAIAARKFNADGTPLDDEFRVSTTTIDNVDLTAVAMDAGGDFVITWYAYNDIGDSEDFYARRYNSNAGTEGIEFLVNTYTSSTINFQHIPAMAMDASGNFIVAWANMGQDESDLGIFAQRFSLMENTPPHTLLLSNNIIQDNSPAGTVVGVLSAMDDELGELSPVFSLVAGTGTGDDDNSLFTIGADNQLVAGAFIDYETKPTLSVRVRATDRGGLFAEAVIALTVNDFDEASGTAAVPGDEFQVNTYTTGYQNKPAIAMDAAGDYVVVWESYQDGYGYGYGIYAQRYNADGSPAGVEFQVNTYTTNDQSDPSVAMDDAGNFVIAWESRNQENPGDNANDIYAQRFDAAGNPQGGEFLVNAYTTNSQADPTIAMDGVSGNFVIAWESRNQENPGDNANDIYAQRFDAAGNPQGGEFLVNAYTTNSQGDPIIAMDGVSGNFVIAWESRNQENPGDNANDIYAQRFDAAGNPQGGEFKVNTYTTNSQSDPSVAMDDAGNFVIAWQSFGQDMSGGGIYARQYLNDGTVSAEFPVNTDTNSSQSIPAVAMDSDGGFVISWLGYQNSQRGIYAKSFNADGSLKKDEFIVEIKPDTFELDNPVIAMDNDGDFVVAWFGGPDFSEPYYDIYARQYFPNQAPTALALGNMEILEGNAISAAIGALATTDPNAIGDSHTYTLVTGTGDTDNASFAIQGGQLVAGAVFDFAKQSSYLVRVRSTDSGGLWIEKAFTITILKDNDAPVIAVNTGLTVGRQGLAAIIADTNLQVTDTDNIATELIYTLSAVTANGTLDNNGTPGTPPMANGDTFTQADINAGQITYTHDNSENLTDSFSFTVTDGDGGGITATAFDISINKNNAPVVLTPVSDPAFQQGFGSASIDITDVFFDADGDSLTIEAISGNENVVTVSLSSNSLSITEVNTGATTITLTADDGKGGIVSDEFNVSVNVPGNNAPVVANAVGDQTFDEGFGSATIDISAVFTDVDTDQLAITAVAADISIVAVSLVGNVLTFTEVNSGTTTITLTAEDGKGGIVSDEFNVSVNVPGNNAPVVANAVGDQTFDEGFGSATIDISAVFTDVDDTDQLAITAVAADISIVAVSLVGNVLTFTEVTSGTTTITLTAEDGKGGIVSDEFNVEVTPVTGLENELSGSLVVYPNPVQGVLTIEIKDGKSGKVNYSIISLEGKIMAKGSFEKSARDAVQVVNVKGYPSGIYNLVLRMGNSELIRRIIKIDK